MQNQDQQALKAKKIFVKKKNFYLISRQIGQF